MPGLVGFAGLGAPPAEARRALVRMRGLVSHGASRHADEPFCEGDLCASRSHTGLTQARPQPHTAAGLSVWLDGEFFNREELARSLRDRPAGDRLPRADESSAGENRSEENRSDGSGSGENRAAESRAVERLHAPDSDPVLLLALYLRHGDFGFLGKIDGVYAAVVYDAGARRVHLISDRYGLRHLFVAEHRGGLAWASEVKAMLALPGFEPKVDRESLRDFFGAGNLLGDRTWFEGVEVLPAATVLTWDMAARTARREKYWGPEEIARLPDSADAAELAEELGRLFREAVARRAPAGGRVGLTLSGGLDSRAILAAVPARGGEPLHAVTYGKRDCEDALVAARAARLKGATHHVLEMDAEGWLAPRLEAVWWTDGELDLTHMHVVTILPLAPALFDFALDGLGANGIIGDSWMDHGLPGPFEYIDGRTRRFLTLGPRVVRGFVEERFPFFDNRFLELSLSAPNRLKEGNALYRMMLLGAFPEFFETIPWQKTGRPLAWPRPGERRRKTAAERWEHLRYKLSWYGLADTPSRGYADYSAWMRQEPARTLLATLLGDRAALYAEYVPRERVLGDMTKHFAGRDRAEFLGRALTFELWLRQVFAGEFRPSPEPADEAVLV